MKDTQLHLDEHLSLIHQRPHSVDEVVGQQTTLLVEKIAKFHDLEKLCVYLGKEVSSNCCFGIGARVKLQVTKVKDEVMLQPGVMERGQLMCRYLGFEISISDANLYDLQRQPRLQKQCSMEDHLLIPPRFDRLTYFVVAAPMSYPLAVTLVHEIVRISAPTQEPKRRLCKRDKLVDRNR